MNAPNAPTSPVESSGDTADVRAEEPQPSGAEFTPAIFTLDAEGRFVRVGLRLARLLGVRRDGLVGLPLTDFLDPYDDEAFADRWFDLLAGAEALEMNTTLVLRDAERRRVRLDLLAQEDGAGGFSGVLTPEAGHRGKAEADFEVARTLMDTLASMVLVLDPQGMPLFSNAGIRSRFGRPLGGKEGGFLLVHSEDRAGFTEVWNEAIVTERAFVHRIRMAAPGEGHHPFRFEARPHFDDLGRIRFWAATLEDLHTEVELHRQLEEAHRFIAQFSEASPDVMFLFDQETGALTYCSEASTRLLGYTPEEMRDLGSNLLSTLIHPDDRGWILEELARTNATGNVDESRTIEYRAVRKDGETVWVATRSLAFDRDSDGRVRTSLGITQGITDRRRTEMEREDHTRILEHALSGVAVVDSEGRYVYVNAGFAGIAGRSPSDLVGRVWIDGLHPEDRVRMEDEYQRMLWSGRIESECRAIRPDGTVYHKHVVTIPKYDGETFAGHYRFVEDITERVNFQQQLEAQLAHISSVTAELEHRSQELEHANGILSKQAASDGLTGLANHRVFQETLARLNDETRPHSLLLFDVDHFKAYNDAFGHPAGDVVLREFAGILGGMTTGDELAARYGGEEFAMVLPDVDLEAAEVRAGLILRRLSEVVWPHREVTASVGGAIWQPGRTRAELIEAADRALYVSKRNGRNRVTAAA